MGNADIAMIGLAVMGENLALNIESRGFSVAVYDIAEGAVDRFSQRTRKWEAVFGRTFPRRADLSAEAAAEDHDDD